MFVKLLTKPNMSKTSIICTLLLLFISTENFSQSKKAVKLSEDFILCAFQRVNGQTTKIIKWELKDTIKYCLEGTVLKFPRRIWDKFTKELTTLIGIPIVETENPSQANIHIYFGEILDYFQKFSINGLNSLVSENTDSWSWRKNKPGGQLLTSSYCIVYTKIKSDFRKEYLLKYLFLKSLGFLGNIDSRSSIFNTSYAEPVVDLFDNDKKLIKLFYSPNIKAGMILSEVENALNEMDLEALATAKL